MDVDSFDSRFKSAATQRSASYRKFFLESILAYLLLLFCLRVVVMVKIYILLSFLEMSHVPEFILCQLHLDWKNACCRLALTLKISSNKQLVTCICGRSTVHGT